MITTSRALEQTERLIETRQAVVAIVGLGFSGMPVATEFARAGFPVLGLDLDPEKARFAEQALRAEASAPVWCSHDTDILREAHAIILCVPTPFDRETGPDLSYVRTAVDQAAARVQPGAMVILQSTVPPGTTRDLLAPALAARGLRIGEDVAAAFAPERIDPGNARYGVRNTPKLVAGLTPVCTRLAAQLLRGCVDTVIEVASPEVAELAKLTENTFRFINIAFANELAVLCRALGVDVYDVIDAASTKPFAFMAHYPGPGVGGHCIPVVPHFLQAAANAHALELHLVSAAARVNDEMPAAIHRRLESLLADAPSRRVLLIGVTYKKDVPDLRESAAVRLLRHLSRNGYAVDYHDPLIPQLWVDERFLGSVPLDGRTLQSYDAVVISVAHSVVDYSLVRERSALVLDLQRVFRADERARVFRM